MFGPFGSYVIPWYGRELERLEALMPADESERIALLTRIEDMRVELDDLIDEGFTALSGEFEKQFNARTRLNTLYERLYRPENEPLLHPLPRADRLIPSHQSTPEQQHYGRSVPIAQYLDSLSNITYGDVSAEVRSGEEYAPWRAAVSRILVEQRNFSYKFSYRRLDGVICLLRDMLPQYLIARWQGAPAIALPLGRSYLDRFGPDYEAYDYITGPLYQALGEEPADFKRMWSAALAGMRRNIEQIPCMRAIAQALRTEAAGLIPSGRMLVLETGLQATMPLLLEGVFPQANEWFMFTAAPWLLDIYAERIFCHQYSRLRPCETLACTETLFRVVFKNSRWYAEENLDAQLRSRAYWEIAKLRSIS